MTEELKLIDYIQLSQKFEMIQKTIKTITKKEKKMTFEEILPELKKVQRLFVKDGVDLNFMLFSYPMMNLMAVQ